MTLSIRVPGSKSMTQRALVIAALAEQESEIHGALDCDDSRLLTRIVEQLGGAVKADWASERLSVTPIHHPLLSARPSLQCGNAGTAMRFSSALALLAPGGALLDGDARMRERPVAPLADSLRQLGAEVFYEGEEGYPPLRVVASGAMGSKAQLDASLSSQFASALLLVAPRLPEGLTLTLQGAEVSRPYLEMTVSMMRRAGATVQCPRPDVFDVAASGYRIPGRPAAQHVEPDWSASAFVWAAAWVLGVQIGIPGLLPAQTSTQGDAVFPAFLKELERARPHRFDLGPTPDLIAPLAVAALFASHPTRIENAAHTRVKESDRIAVLSAGFRDVGAEVHEFDDGMEILPGIDPVGPVILDPAGDHRMAMAFGLLSLESAGISVREPDCVSKSYPAFWKDLERLRLHRDARFR